MENQPKSKQKKEEDEEKELHRSQQIIVFKLASEEYALPIDHIKEVVPTPSVSKVPLTPKHIRGVANIRGNILAVVDLEEKFGLNDEEHPAMATKGTYCLVVASKEYNMAILVEKVPNTLAIAEEEIDYSPGIINSEAGDKRYVRGIINTRNRLIILIDVFKIFDKQDVVAAVAKA